MSSKKRIYKHLRNAAKATNEEAQVIRPRDTLVDYIKLLYEMDQEAKHAAELRKERDASE